MTMQNLPSYSALYPFYLISPSMDTSNSYTLDASGEKTAMVIKPPKAGNISHVGFRVNSVTTAQTLRVGLETLDANGDPSSTQYGGSAVGTQTSPVANTYYEVALGTAATVSAADITNDVPIAIVIQFDSTTGNLQISRINQFFSTLSFPYGDNYVASWIKDTGSYLHCVTIKYDDGTYFTPFTIPISSTTVSSAFNNGSTPDERALKFQVPFPVNTWGAWVNVTAGTTANFEIVLYDASNNILDTVVVTAVNLGSTSSRLMFVSFSSIISLSKNVWYRLSVKPTTANNVTLYQFTVNSTAIMDSLSGGQNCFLSTRTDAGSWTDTATTTRPMVGLLLCGFDDGVGGGSGGMLVHSGMTGGLNG